MYKTRRWVAVALVLLAALALQTANVTPAAAASCTYHGCDTKDPHTAGCDNSATTSTLLEFTSEEDGFMRVELRYSSVCHAAWTRATIGAPGMPPHNYIAIRAYSSSSGGSPIATYWKKITNSTNNTPPSGTYVWSPMRSFSDFVQACLLKKSNNTGHCTGRR